MNRAQPTSRASGVRCTAWLEGRGHGRTHAIRRTRPAVIRTRGHGTPWHAPPLTRTRPARDSRARQRAGHTWPSSQRARRAVRQRAVI